MAGFTQRLYKTVCVKVPDGVFVCETADLHSGRNFMQHTRVIQSQEYGKIGLDSQTLPGAD